MAVPGGAVNLDVEVLYKNNRITYLSETGTKTLETAGTFCEDDIVINYTKTAGSVTAPATISGNSATVTAGTNTLTLEKTVSVTPNVTTAGYISSGTAGNSVVSLTANVNTRSSSDLTASGATVTAPAGYYGSAATKSVASGSATTPATTITSTPTITFDSSTGVVTASHSTSRSITPSITAGYVSIGTAGTVSTSGTQTYTFTIYDGSVTSYSDE